MGCGVSRSATQAREYLRYLEVKKKLNKSMEKNLNLSFKILLNKISNISK